MSSIPSERVIALVDCNNFYVSCERVFAPWLEGKPVAVLSNNDGCVIARSEQLKALGVAMGTPVQALLTQVQSQPVQVLSSNYALYGDMSARGYPRKPGHFSRVRPTHQCPGALLNDNGA